MRPSNLRNWLKLRDSGNYATLNSPSHYGHWAAVIGTPPGRAAADVVAMIVGTADDEDDAGGDDAILPMENMKTVANGIRPIRVADFFPAWAMFEALVKRRPGEPILLRQGTRVVLKSIAD